MNATCPIGVFDSGIGGLTVASAIRRALPNESILYFGDTAHLPYGEKSADAIRYYCIRISQFLLDHDCKMIVLACNSASSAAYDILVDFFKNKSLFVNVVDPLVKLAQKKEYKKVGVIATKATISSNAYRSKLVAADPNKNVVQLATPLLVPMIEEGFYNDNISEQIIHKYLSDDSLQNLDALLLACTHYPLIRKHIEQYYKGKVDVIDSAEPVAVEVKRLLSEKALLNNSQKPVHRFFVSDYTRSFEETTKLFYPENISLEEVSIW